MVRAELTKTKGSQGHFLVVTIMMMEARLKLKRAKPYHSIMMQK